MRIWRGTSWLTVGVLDVGVDGLSRRGVTCLRVAAIWLPVRRLAVRLCIVRTSLLDRYVCLRLVLHVSCLNDDDLLTAARNEATPDKERKEKSYGDIAARFNAALSAVFDDHDYIGKPYQPPDNVKNNTNFAARSINANVNGGIVIVRIVRIAVTEAVSIRFRVGACE
jgi:hypothetical protein